MAETHRVPLQPIKKGSLVKLWLGVAVVLLLAAGMAWMSTPKGVEISVLTAGVGGSPTDGDVVIVNYTGKLADGTKFDEGQNQPMQIGGTIPGFDEALRKMQAGGKYTIMIPSELAYGATPPPGAPIPANADLTFDVELIEFMSEADYVARAQAMQQLMQQMQQQGGAPEGAAPPTP